MVCISRNLVWKVGRRRRSGYTENVAFVVTGYKTSLDCYVASHSCASSCKFINRVTRQCHSNTFVHPSASRNVYLYCFVSRTLKVLKLPHWPLLNLRFQWLIFPHSGAWFQATIAVTIVECWTVHVYGQTSWIKAIDVNIFLIFIFSMNKLLSVVTSLDEEFTWTIWTFYWYLSRHTNPPSPFTDHWLLSGRYSY